MASGVMLLFLAITLGKAGSGKLFAVAAILDELRLQRGDLLVEQIVGLVDEA